MSACDWRSNAPIPMPSVEHLRAELLALADSLDPLPSSVLAVPTKRRKGPTMERKPKRIRIEVEYDDGDPVVLEVREPFIEGFTFNGTHPPPLEAVLLRGERPTMPPAPSELSLRLLYRVPPAPSDTEGR
jgi:hypothetical protein